MSATQTRPRSVTVEGEATRSVSGRGQAGAASTAPACLNLDPQIFDRSNSAAAAVCSACPVRDDCLSGALERDERYGVWGGHVRRFGRWQQIGVPTPVAEWAKALPSGVLKAHAAFIRGQRDAVTVAGERDYQRAYKRAARAERKAG